MKNKTNQLDLLFEEWEQLIPAYKGHFIRDGILNESLYQVAPKKILFITKEPNNPKQDAGDFREWWKERIAYTFSNRIAEWSFGILNNFPEYDEIRKENSLHDAMQCIAFMNIKKSGGNGTAEYNLMMEHLKHNFDLIHRQIEIISPDIIITGTSWKELRNGLLPSVKWIQSGYDIAIGRFNNAKVIDFYHPSSRTAPAASYSLLQNIILSNKFKSL